ncbi:MAG: hypothetical protein JWO51_2351 [Rhodospirillales bacterium]|nr:hypothetical protein [Rhodospirillales bacterium]
MSNMQLGRLGTGPDEPTGSRRIGIRFRQDRLMLPQAYLNRSRLLRSAVQMFGADRLPIVRRDVPAQARRSLIKQLVFRDDVGSIELFAALIERAIEPWKRSYRGRRICSNRRGRPRSFRNAACGGDAAQQRCDRTQPPHSHAILIRSSRLPSKTLPREMRSLSRQTLLRWDEVRRAAFLCRKTPG